MAMHRADHIAIAKAIRDADMYSEDQETIARALVVVCADRTPDHASFDPELFLAYALSPSPLSVAQDA